MGGRLGLAALAVLVLPVCASGQWRGGSDPSFEVNHRLATQLAPQALSAEPARVAGMSLLVPGLGQHKQDRNRKWMFAAAEVLAWSFFAERRRSGSELRDQYLDVAWDRGRLQGGARVEGDFEYYETMTKWARSGAFDADPLASGLQPEADVNAYNGLIWQRAQSLFLGGKAGQEGEAAYEQARAYYRTNAYGEAFLWDWSSDAGGQQAMGGLIKDSDDRFRQATTAVGVVIANHLVAAVDAFLRSRVASGFASLEVLPNQTRSGLGWSTRVRVRVGR
ncbi:MAG: hypothetical protein O2992_10780 [Gemmatimonadetes bacterium]|nr:hypothetical protein [Gemmatimonadota bacterium]